MKIVCISGKAQHGKDTTAKLLEEILEAQGNRVLIAHYGDLVKYVCKTFFGWDGKKDERDARFSSVSVLTKSALSLLIIG